MTMTPAVEKIYRYSAYLNKKGDPQEGRIYHYYEDEEQEIWNYILDHKSLTVTKPLLPRVIERGCLNGVYWLGFKFLSMERECKAYRIGDPNTAVEVELVD